MVMLTQLSVPLPKDLWMNKFQTRFEICTRSNDVILEEVGNTIAKFSVSKIRSSQEPDRMHSAYMCILAETTPTR